ncbi:MAG: hypothetical protein JXR91_01040 [Deltaproteobacteria bacterium]|nr:hypothetical protein [Deltaproteobacteria bacterium]
MADDKNTIERNMARGTDGTTLDIIVDDSDKLPHGLVRLRSGVIAITHVYCPNGHNLVDDTSDARFNGYPGISLKVKGLKKEGIVIMSPIHGDDTRFGISNFEPGEITRISCPVCDTELPVIQDCGCTSHSKLVGLYLDPELVDGSQVVLCNSWGCLRSRITDRFQIISKLD